MSPSKYDTQELTALIKIYLPVQGIEADAFNLALSLVSRGLQGSIHVLWMLPHEEIIMEAIDGIQDQVKTVVKESMEAAFEKIIPEVPFAVEIRMADSWG